MNSLTLEQKLFKGSTQLGIILLCVLVIHNTIFDPLYYAVILEIIGLAVLLINFIILRKRPPSERQIIIFCVIVMLLMNLGWITTGGIDLLNATVYFITSSVVMLLMQRKYYLWIGHFVFVNLVVLYYLESVVNPKIFGVTMEMDNDQLASDYFAAFILFSFGGYLLAFTKMNYIREKDKLEEINLALHQTHETLNDTVSELEEKQLELAKTKDLLETMVEERTQDLAQANDRLLNKNQQLEQYSYIISHNLKAPVAQIKGLTHLLPVKDSFDKYHERNN
ncbi:MAG: hypothetical protein U5K79_22550 [Cyclobacteriaceae bacterium]|nr:hypothetical protein [Cyclobacteriaceae bacterium]